MHILLAWALGSVVLVVAWLARYAYAQGHFRRGTVCLTSIPSVDVSDLLPRFMDLQPMYDSRSKQDGMMVKGTRFSETDLAQHVPELMRAVTSEAFRERVAILLGYNPASTLIFARLYATGDNIKGHYDQNNTVGRRHTCILPLDVSPCNTSRFQFLDPCTGVLHTSHQSIGKLYAYEGNRVFHQVTSQSDGCHRFVLIFAFWETTTRSLKQFVRHHLVRTASKFIDF